MRNASLGLMLALVVGCGGAKSMPSASTPTGAPGLALADAMPTDVAREAPASAPAVAPAVEAAPTSVARAEGAAKSVAGGVPAGHAPSSGPVTMVRPELPQSGQLTAGVWDDNLNFGFFRPYAGTERGADLALFSLGERERARDLALAAHAAKTQLDVQLVLDTTGSMGDELRYLQSEFDSIAATLAQRFPNVVPRWSLVVYRDHGDDYVTRRFDFTSDTAQFRGALRRQAAGGGGDFPEAVVDAWRTGLGQSWRADSRVAKIAFWVADAPTHEGEGAEFTDLMRKASAQGVHVYPIASSGIDETAEYEMRSAAQRTGGRYVFLTDDSGIGSSHAEPHIPCYTVARLDRTIVRMVESELTGQHPPPAANDVVRRVGNPTADGRCQLQNQMIVASY